MPKISVITEKLCANKKMQYKNEKNCLCKRYRASSIEYRASCNALTLVEMIIAMAIMVIVFAAIVPQFRIILNSWDSKAGAAEALQNGRVLIDHLNRNLSKAVRITAVSASSVTNGYIQFIANDSNTYRYDIGESNYVEFGPVGSLADLAGPVSSLQFTCYDGNNFTNAITDGNFIRFVDVNTTLTNLATLGQDKTFKTSAYLRTNAQGSDCWQNDDIGEVGAVGSATESDGTWTIEGSGLDIWDYTDEFHYVYQSLSGPGQIIARVVSVENTNSWAKAGVMIRETLDGDSKHAMMVVTPGNGTAFQRRLNTGGVSTTSGGSAVTAPYWVKLKRVGNVFTGYESADGSTWTLIGSDTVSMVTDVYIGLAVTSHSDGDLCTAEIDNVGFSTVEYQPGFTEAKVSSDGISITIPTPGSVDAVNILGSWTQGTTHTKESGTNRALVFTVHAEGNNSGSVPSLTSVTYGGRTMTKVVERANSSGTTRTYTAAFILNDAGITAATTTTFTPNWSTAPTNVAYGSVFLQNVNQTTLTGATASNQTPTGGTITTSALANSAGDMVIDAATCSTTGTYTTNGFTKALELTISNADGVDGYKSATGASETPSVTHSNTTNRQTLIGFVVNVNEEVRGIEGDLLIAAVATDGSTTISPLSSKWHEIDQGSFSGAVTLGAWWKLAEDPESASHEFTWSAGNPQQAYGWMMHFTGHNSAEPINDYSTYGVTNINPTSPEVTTTVNNCLILRLGAFDNDAITVDIPGLTTPILHAPITMDTSTTTTVEFVAAGTAASGTGAITVAWPTHQVGDIALLFVESCGGQAANLSPSAGFVNVLNSPQSTGTGTAGTRITVYWCRATSSSMSSPTVTDPGNHVYGIILTFRGVVTTGDPWDVAVGGTKATASPTTTFGAVTTSVNNDLIVLAASRDNDSSSGAWSSWTNANLSSLTERADEGTGSGNGGGVGVATGVKSTAGDTGPTTATVTSSVDGHMTIALKPPNTAVSGGAGYVGQASSGDSGTSTFALTASNASRMLTIAIAPADTNSCEGSIIQP
jgi:type II secretory pathway pseudopilin PulG